MGYLFSMGQMIYSHMGRIIGSYRRGDVVMLGKCPIPTYLTNWQDAFNLILMFVLIVAMSTEPILHCLSNEDVELFATVCPEVEGVSQIYYTMNMVCDDPLLYPPARSCSFQQSRQCLR